MYGFDNVWIQWVMACVELVTYSVLINGQSFGFIQPERGLRQGDPLSHFLFMMCTEALIHLFQKAERERRLSGIQFSENGPAIHDLLFADNSLFSCEVTDAQCEEVKRCLQQYGSISGQVINFEKSSVTFGSNVAEEVKIRLKDKLGIQNEGGLGMYLGLPESFSGSKQQLLAYVRDRLHKKLSGWYAKFLSQGGKEILIKSVALALSVYVMSCFRLTKDLCKKMTRMVKFYWPQQEIDHRMLGEASCLEESYLCKV